MKLMGKMHLNCIYVRDPIELTEEIAVQAGLKVDMTTFESEMQQQRDATSSTSKFSINASSK
ncbi:hypothetical protein ACVXZY_09220 [Staphylococcus aureus]